MSWLLIVLQDMTLPAIVRISSSCREKIELPSIWFLEPFPKRRHSSTATMSMWLTYNIASGEGMNSPENILEQQLKGENMNTTSKSSQHSSTVEIGSGICSFVYPRSTPTAHPSGPEIILDHSSSSESFHRVTTSFNERRSRLCRLCMETS